MQPIKFFLWLLPSVLIPGTFSKNEDKSTVLFCYGKFNTALVKNYNQVIIEPFHFNLTEIKQLKKDNKKFRIIFIGDGPDTNFYKEEVKNKKLEHEIVFLGRKKNPYPYYKLCDCVVLSSDYEGYPVVYLESFILDKPIITTNVSDSEQIEGQGIVVEKDETEIYKAMKDFIEKGYQITKQFDAKDYNNNIFNKLQEIIS